MRDTWLLEGLMRLIPLVLSLTVHEWAHAYAAFRLGDDTGAREGRMTLNPLPHMDPVGTFLLPLLGIPFGWAKPVPINPARFRRDVSLGTGVMLTAAAGPASNLVLALLCALGDGLVLRFGLAAKHSNLLQLLTLGMQMNVLLCVFNLLPVPPLDGSRIVEGLIPYRKRPLWNSVMHVSWLGTLVMITLGLVLMIGPMLWISEALQTVVAALAG